MESSSPTSANPSPPRPEGGSGTMFDNIADRYDLLNRIISLGVDQSWRRKTVDALALKEGQRALDLATGTADLALLMARRAPGCHVTGVDPSTGMLGVGLRKVADADLKDRIALKVGDAQALDYPDKFFDGTTIAFGIRNVPDRAAALKEMARVTKSGGKVAILELSEPEGGIIAPFARFHVHTLVPWLGALLSGAKEYRYLQKSIAAFPPAGKFAELMEESHLKVLEVQSLTFGVAHLYIATPT